MSTTQGVRTLSVPAGEDLNGQLYAPLTIDGNGRYILADAATDVVHAILFMDPKRVTAAGDHVSVMDIHAGGIGLVKAAEAIAVGRILTAPAAGNEGGAESVANIAGLVANQSGFGIALEAASAADEIIRFHAGLIAGPTA